jgi:hypothetical protein
MHFSPRKQETPHAPQFSASLAIVTQKSPHNVSDGWQAGAAHAPLRHTCPEGQTFPHAPQFAASVASLVHAPAQGSCPSWHLS